MVISVHRTPSGQAEAVISWGDKWGMPKFDGRGGLFGVPIVGVQRDPHRVRQSSTKITIRNRNDGKEQQIFIYHEGDNHESDAMFTAIQRG